MAQAETTLSNGSAHFHTNNASNPTAANGKLLTGECLKIVIVGAGIGGLTAAITLRRQGHEVILLEQSKISNETGAALHIAPNANGLLRRLGLPPEDIGAVPMLGFAEYAPSGELNFYNDLTPSLSIWQYQWMLGHRVELHRALREMALAQGGEGKPATLRLGARVASVDAQKATVTLVNGETLEADLVVGADGVHSVTRKLIPGGDVKTFDSGKSAFRFLIRRDAALADPLTKEFAERYGCFTMWLGSDRRIVMYPCSYNELLNFVCIHPSELTHAHGDAWNEGGSKDKLLEVYKDFGPNVEALLSKADAAALKVWNLLDMPVIPSWTQDRLALLGDAAHPFLPHQGQGGAVAIEDGVSLGVMFPRNTPREEIPERLKLYEKCRYDRANKIQEYTRIAGLDPDKRKLNIVMEFTIYNFTHDEYDHSMQALRKWEWLRRPDLHWLMPTAFGPSYASSPAAPSRETTSQFLRASVKFKTSRTVLQNLLPNPSFTFATPGTVKYASYVVTVASDQEYPVSRASLGLYIHGIQYTKKDGSTLLGKFLVVLLESDAESIVRNRETLGISSVHCFLDVDRGPENSVHVRADMFANLEWTGLQSTPPQEAITSSDPNNEERGILTHRYIPAVGQPGKSDAEYAVWIPDQDAASEEDGPASGKRAKIHYTAQAKVSLREDVGPDVLPTAQLRTVVSRLAQVPVREIVESNVSEWSGGNGDFGKGVRVD